MRNMENHKNPNKKIMFMNYIFLGLAAFFIAWLLSLIVMGFGISSDNKFTDWLYITYPASKWEVDGPDCVNWDTDGDSYISCTAVAQNRKTGQAIPIEVECNWIFGGCRKPKMNFR